MKSTKLKILLAFIIGILGFNLVSPITASAAESTNPCDYLEGSAKEAHGCNGSSDKLPNVVIGILNAVIAVAGIVAVIYIVVGGYQYMTSTGDPGKVKKAKDTILYGIIGLVIVILAAAIVNFVIANVVGGN